tara:strand:- start:234 stop:521 length:288 start_codon:yes stop_codon:yes gene_type:complete
MRLGKVEINYGYVVDLDNEEMVEQAEACLYEDLLQAYKSNEIEHWIGKKEADRFNPAYSEDDIPSFLTEDDVERKEEQRRDEKRGLYPDRDDIAN